MLAEVEDEDLLDELAAVFEQHFSEMYDDEEEDEENEDAQKMSLRKNRKKNLQ